MNTAMSKTNITKFKNNSYSWLLNTIETPYQGHSESCCERFLEERDLFLR